MANFFVDDSVIIDAWLIVLQRNREQDKRPLRNLVHDDLSIIHAIRRELAQLWALEKGKVNYKTLRDTYLDQRAIRENWSTETRNLYASILSVIGNWHKAGGRDQKSIEELQQIWVGADLLLQFSDLPIQKKMQL